MLARSTLALARLASVLALILAAGLAAGACQKKQDPGPSCEAIMPHLAIVMKQGLTGHGAVEFGDKQRDVQTCKARALTADQRRCLLATKTVADIAGCNAGRGSDAPVPPAQPTPRRLPVPSGSDVPAP